MLIMTNFDFFYSRKQEPAESILDLSYKSLPSSCGGVKTTLNLNPSGAITEQSLGFYQPGNTDAKEDTSGGEGKERR